LTHQRAQNYGAQKIGAVYNNNNNPDISRNIQGAFNDLTDTLKNSLEDTNKLNDENARITSQLHLQSIHKSFQPSLDNNESERQINELSSTYNAHIEELYKKGISPNLYSELKNGGSLLKEQLKIRQAYGKKELQVKEHQGHVKVNIGNAVKTGNTEMLQEWYSKMEKHGYDFNLKKDELVSNTIKNRVSNKLTSFNVAELQQLNEVLDEADDDGNASAPAFSDELSGFKMNGYDRQNLKNTIKGRISELQSDKLLDLNTRKMQGENIDDMELKRLYADGTLTASARDSMLAENQNKLISNDYGKFLDLSLDITSQKWSNNPNGKKAQYNEMMNKIFSTNMPQGERNRLIKSLQSGFASGDKDGYKQLEQAKKAYISENIRDLKASVKVKEDGLLFFNTKDPEKASQLFYTANASIMNWIDNNPNASWEEVHTKVNELKTDIGKTTWLPQFQSTLNKYLTPLPASLPTAASTKEGALTKTETPSNQPPAATLTPQQKSAYAYLLSKGYSKEDIEKNYGKQND